MSTDWEDRYIARDTPWDKGEPSPGLVDFLATKRSALHGTVLVPGCGKGYDAIAFAKAGFDSTGVDLAPTAVKVARQNASHIPNVQFHAGDFLADRPFAQFDVVFEHTLYCAIQPWERAAYLDATLRWLKPRGHLLAVHYMIPDTDGPPFGTDRAEVVSRFSPRFHLLEEWEPRSYPNRTGLERMFLWERRAGG